jgi:hypothetical protein
VVSGRRFIERKPLACAVQQRRRYSVVKDRSGKWFGSSGRDVWAGLGGVFVLVVSSARESHCVDVGSPGWVANVDGCEWRVVMRVGPVPWVVASGDVTDTVLSNRHCQFLHVRCESSVSTEFHFSTFGALNTEVNIGSGPVN